MGSAVGDLVGAIAYLTVHIGGHVKVLRSGERVDVVVVRGER